METSSRRPLSTFEPYPGQLKALSHPVRLRMLDLLRLDGSATSTMLAGALGMNTGTVSYHLRQLAAHGFIEDEPGHPDGRQRWWRATREFTHVGYEEPVDGDHRLSRDAYVHTTVMEGVTQLQKAIHERGQLPTAWAQVTEDSDWTIWLTPLQAGQLMERLTATIREAAELAPRTGSQLDEESEQYTIQLHGFPRPGRLVHSDNP